nr:methyl-accepting chemotaxis protein [uncultured Desulfobacter sp.]
MATKQASFISLKTKLIAGFLITSLITLIVGGIGYFRISSNIDRVDAMVAQDVHFLEQTKEFKILALQHRRYEKDLFLNIGNKKKQEGYLKKFDKKSTRTLQLIDTIAAMVKDDPMLGDDALQSISKAKSAYIEYKNHFMQLSQTVLSDENITPQNANKLMVPFKEHIYHFESNIDKLEESALKKVENASENVIQSGKRAKIFIGAFVVIGFVFSALLGLVIAGKFTAPVLKAVRFAEKMAEGDLKQVIDVKQNDEIGQLARSLNAMSQSMRAMFEDIIKSSDTLNSSSTQLSAVAETMLQNVGQSTDQSGRVGAAGNEMTKTMTHVTEITENTEANIQMIVSATEEMTATIQEIFKNTADGSTITQKAVEDAKQVSDKVNILGKATRDISKVTETIDDISEQTNLLALNATIEAARAGEAGKGFAVVAGEIKTLAQQTSDATREINQRIEGVQSVTTESIQAIETIVEVINEINDIVNTVATAIEQQSSTTQEISSNVAQAASGVQEVNESVNQTSAVIGDVVQDISGIDRTLQDVYQGSRQVSESSTHLAELSKRLNSLINRFKI